MEEITQRTTVMDEYPIQWEWPKGFNHVNVKPSPKAALFYLSTKGVWLLPTSEGWVEANYSEAKEHDYFNAKMIKKNRTIQYMLAL
jgi:hypothetical protein